MEQQATWRDGLRAVAPILLGIIPFGLIFGVTAAASDVEPIPAWASSFVVFAGAAQLAIVDVLDSGGAAAIAILTAVVINLRMMMYSADLGRYTVDLTLPRKLSAAYLLTDQAYLVTAHRFRDPGTARGFFPFYLGAGLGLWGTWQLSTTSGLVLGAAVPESWQLGFAVPLTFLALLVLAIRDRPGLLAALTGGIVALAAVPLPYNLGLLVGALAGVAAGMISERWLT